MGNDGGTIPRRSEMVREKAKIEKMDASLAKRAKFSSCALSKRPLKAPLVGCGVGNIYNKEAVIEYLLHPDKFSEARFICPHVKTLRDVTDLRVSFNPAYQPEGVAATTSVAGSTGENFKFPLLCPITLKEMNGAHGFVFQWSCGCLYSENALKAIPTAERQCIQCGNPTTPDDRVPVYPQEKVLDRVVEQMKNRRTRMNEEKAHKKRSKKKRYNGSTPVGDPKSRFTSTDHHPAENRSVNGKALPGVDNEATTLWKQRKRYIDNNGLVSDPVSVPKALK
ncbi:Replication termination factor 2 [Dispira simplex]|nr:Replication termination factor 2 [Dispira simplex]